MRETKLDPYSELVRLIARTQSRIEQEINIVLQNEDARLTVQHWLVLEELSTTDGKSMGDIQKSTLINDSTLTKLVDRLVSLNLAYRSPDEGDRRKVLIFLSRVGAPFIRKIRSMIKVRQRALFDPVPVSKGDLATTLDLLEALSGPIG